MKYSTRKGKGGEKERQREGKTWKSNSPMGMHGIRPSRVVVNKGRVNSHTRHKTGMISQVGSISCIARDSAM